ncbi:uncharacterized protein LOC128404001 isoform X2 [Podarcis raffonei]|uniref:uncharacterized protein LOC128404001 isoform X2 n=1 Tax=Podarcis raffonei TaxID=65483 RepID=UPI0023295156|nr:uncharacterized protein LOC128404001 isoform X2 [Podarcis raffonei]
MEEQFEDGNLVQDLKEDPEERDLASSLPDGTLAHSSPETGIDLWIWVPYLEGPSWNSDPLQDLERCLRELPQNPPSQLWLPTASSSNSSSPERQHPWTMEEVEALSSAQEDTGSKVDWTLWQKGTEFSPWSALLSPEEERGLPSTQKPELITMGSRALSASPLPILDRFLANIAMSQLLPSNIPPGDAKSPGNVAPRRSWQGMVGSHPTKATADPGHQPVLDSWKEEEQETAAKKKPLKGVLKRLKELINRHPPHIFRRNLNSSRQSALQQKTRKGTCRSPHGQVKMEEPSEDGNLVQDLKEAPEEERDLAPSLHLAVEETKGQNFY